MILRFFRFIFKFIQLLFGIQSKQMEVTKKEIKKESKKEIKIESKPIQQKPKKEVKFVEKVETKKLHIIDGHSYDSIKCNKRDKTKYIILHCSDSAFGNAELIHDWHIHRDEPFKMIGYHFVIQNGKESSRAKYDETKDGVIEKGRDLMAVGAHALGYNTNSVGICLIGKKTFTDKQFESLRELVKELQKQFDIPTQNILGHYETAKANGKTCPNFDVEKFRNSL